LVWNIHEPFNLVRHELQYSKDGFVWLFFKELKKSSDKAISLQIDIEQQGFYRVISEDFDKESGISNIVSVDSNEKDLENSIELSAKPVFIEHNGEGRTVTNTAETSVSVTFYSLSGTQLDRFILPPQSKLMFPSNTQQSPIIVHLENPYINARTIVFP